MLPGTRAASSAFCLLCCLAAHLRPSGPPQPQKSAKKLDPLQGGGLLKNVRAWAGPSAAVLPPPSPPPTNINTNTGIR